MYCAFGIATTTAKPAKVNRKTVNTHFNDIRKKLLPESLKEPPLDGGEFELDEPPAYMPVSGRSEFAASAGGARRESVCKKRERYVCRSCSKEELMPVIQGRHIWRKSWKSRPAFSPTSPIKLACWRCRVYTGGWNAYDGLILNGYEHYRVYHSENEFVRGKSHVNGIENAQTMFALEFCEAAADEVQRHVWRGCAGALRWRVAPWRHLCYTLKECEFRYNHRNEDLLKLTAAIFKR